VWPLCGPRPSTSSKASLGPVSITRDGVQNARDARSGPKRDGWRACLARRVPVGTRKPTGASDARFGPNPGGPWFCGSMRRMQASLRIRVSRPGSP
jgi:hypothetical protein